MNLCPWCNKRIKPIKNIAYSRSCLANIRYNKLIISDETIIRFFDNKDEILRNTILQNEFPEKIRQRIKDIYIDISSKTDDIQYYVNLTFLYFSILKKKYSYLYDGFIDCIRPEPNRYVKENFKKDLKKNNLKLYLKYYSHSCLNCYKDIDSENIFCSHTCYHEASRTGIYDASNSEETKRKISKIMKDKISNGTFTPNITNSWAKSRCYVDYIPFRSSWEACFYLQTGYDYEQIRIPYIGLDGNSHSYIIDFHNEHKKELIEIKPIWNQRDATVIVKYKAAQKWCKVNGYALRFVDERDLFKNKELILSQLHRCDKRAKELILKYI